ncbi:MAG: hypothetical protein RIR00_1345 [Pseudomonadota bacterium]
MAEFFGDQAAGLRRLFGRNQFRVVTFAAGCVGVGKTITVSNLAVALARLGREVLVIDENSGHDDLAGQFGTVSRYDLLNVVHRECRLSDVLLHPCPGVSLLPAARAVKRIGRLSLPQQQALLDGISELDRPVDVILVDAAIDHLAGLSPLGLASQETLIVLSASGNSITEAYALIKKLSMGYARRHFRILINKVRQQQDALAIFDNIASLTAERRIAQLDFAGAIPLDDALRQADKVCQPVLLFQPESPASHALRELASGLLYWPVVSDEEASVQQYMQQLLHLSQRLTPGTLRAV